MSLLTIVQSLAKDVGMEVPDSVFGNTNRETVEARDFANAAGQEIARRIDWQELRKTHSITGTGAKTAHAMPGDFSRLSGGGAVTAAGVPLPGLISAEWSTLAQVEGVPRYYLREGSQISLWPYLASGQTAVVQYQSSNWLGGDRSLYGADEDEALFPEDVLTKGLIYRWRRQKGMPYADYEAEYEATLIDYGDFQNGPRL